MKDRVEERWDGEAVERAEVDDTARELSAKAMSPARGAAECRRRAGKEEHVGKEKEEERRSLFMFANADDAPLPRKTFFEPPRDPVLLVSAGAESATAESIISSEAAKE